MQNEIDIKALRKDLGESQEVFASRFGVTQTAVSLWETRGAPRRGLVRKMIEELRKRTPQVTGAQTQPEEAA